MKTRQTETMSRAQLLFLFLRGSKRYYLLAILGSLFVTLTEMITPQIIKITVDSVIGDAPLDAPFFLESASPPWAASRRSRATCSSSPRPWCSSRR